MAFTIDRVSPVPACALLIGDEARDNCPVRCRNERAGQRRVANNKSTTDSAAHTTTENAGLVRSDSAPASKNEITVANAHADAESPAMRPRCSGGVSRVMNAMQGTRNA